MKARIALFAVVALFSSPVMNAAVYKWVDEEGKVHYSSEKPEQNPAHEVAIQKSRPQPHLVEGPDGQMVEAKSETGSLVERCQGVESFVLTGVTYCCTAACVTAKRTQSINFSCAAQPCYEALLSTPPEKRSQAKTAADRQMEYAKERADRNAELKAERDRKIVEDCRARRDTNCDKGAEGIVRDAEREAARLNRAYIR